MEALSLLRLSLPLELHSGCINTRKLGRIGSLVSYAMYTVILPYSHKQTLNSFLNYQFYIMFIAGILSLNVNCF